MPYIAPKGFQRGGESHESAHQAGPLLSAQSQSPIPSHSHTSSLPAQSDSSPPHSHSPTPQSPRAHSPSQSHSIPPPLPSQSHTPSPTHHSRESSDMDTPRPQSSDPLSPSIRDMKRDIISSDQAVKSISPDANQSPVAMTQLTADLSSALIASSPAPIEGSVSDSTAPVAQPEQSEQHQSPFTLDPLPSDPHDHHQRSPLLQSRSRSHQNSQSSNRSLESQATHSRSTPSLTASCPTSASETSLVSLGSDDQSDSPAYTNSNSPADGVDSPATTAYSDNEAATGGGGVLDDAVQRYKEGLYAYTRSLYMEAKNSQKRKEGQAPYAQFGLKQSGMERIAAKKALARRLNG